MVAVASAAATTEAVAMAAVEVGEPEAEAEAEAVASTTDSAARESEAGTVNPPVGLGKQLLQSTLSLTVTVAITSVVLVDVTTLVDTTVLHDVLVTVLGVPLPNPLLLLPPLPPLPPPFPLLTELDDGAGKGTPFTSVLIPVSTGAETSTTVLGV